MKSVSGAQAVLRTSAAVVTMFWLAQGAMAQEADAEDPADVGGEVVEITLDPIETGEDWVLVDEEPALEDIVAFDGEVELSDGIGDGVPLDDEVLLGEGEAAGSDDGVTEEEPVFVSTCGGCELEFGAGGPEVQRDDSPVAVISGGLNTGSDSEVSATSSNACDSGWMSTAWICTVQNGSWRD